MTRSCRICDNASGNTPYRVREMMFGTREEFEYFQCAACECLQIADIPADMARHYPAAYYSYSGSDLPETLSGFKRVLKTARLNRYLGGRGLAGEVLLKALGPPELPPWVDELRPDPRARILDYGCGAGHFLNRLAFEGYTRLAGADPFIPGDIHYPNGITVRRAEASELNGEFDLITLHHSFEHFADPRGSLGDLERILAPGGTLLIRIPVVSSYAWHHYRENWAQLDAPRHFYLHSVKSMTRLAEQLGFRVLRLWHDSTALQFWASEQVARDIPLEDPRSCRHGIAGSGFSKTEIDAFTLRARELNEAGQGDQACFVLGRRDA